MEEGVDHCETTLEHFLYYWDVFKKKKKKNQYNL